jgi:hypothetical protein
VLGEPVEELQLDDGAVPLAERAEQSADGETGLGGVVADLLGADSGRIRALVVVAGWGQRHGPVRGGET